MGCSMQMCAWVWTGRGVDGVWHVNGRTASILKRGICLEVILQSLYGGLAVRVAD